MTGSLFSHQLVKPNTSASTLTWESLASAAFGICAAEVSTRAAFGC